MDIVTDGLLIATTLTASLYCWVLSRRLRRLGDLDTGLGARIAALDDALRETRSALTETQSQIEELTRGAGATRERLAQETRKARKLADELAERASDAERRLARLLATDPATSEPAAGQSADTALIEIVPEDDTGPPAGAPAHAEEEEDGASGSSGAESLRGKGLGLRFPKIERMML